MPGLHVHHPNHEDPCRHLQIRDFVILEVVVEVLAEDHVRVAPELRVLQCVQRQVREHQVLLGVNHHSVLHRLLQGTNSDHPVQDVIQSHRVHVTEAKCPRLL